MRNFATTTDLMTHQRDAVQKVLPSRVGALFMDMGTGKSRTAIELSKIRHHKIDKVVWFCPVSLKTTVRAEILKHTDCGLDDICVFDNKITEQTIPDAMWYIVGIESMSSSARVIFTTNKLITERTFVILDESTLCKTPGAKRTQRITKLSERSRYRMILTGTPLTQGVVDLYAQMAFLSKKILGYHSFYSFAMNHLEYSERFPDMIVRAHNTEYLAAKIKPYVYQVTKEECVTLPKKLYSTIYYEMTEEQRYYYEEAKWELLERISVDDFDSTTIFRLFSALQSIVSGYWRYKGKRIEFNHDRVDTLIHATWRVPEDKKVIIWAKYHYDIVQIEQALKKEYPDDGIAFYHGRLNEKKRAAELEKFRNDHRFLVATPGCGGKGLTLNEAHYVIFYNNTFKYSDREQAEDRCHRIGQQHNVTYIDICCWNSIDERIQTAIAEKSSLQEEFRREVNKVKKSGSKNRIKELIQSL